MKDDIKIIFTKHAFRKLRQRNIKQKFVSETILCPEKLITNEGDKYYAFKKYGKLYLKVVFKRIGKVIIVITQYLTEKTQ